MLKLSIAFAAIAVPLQVLVGDQHGLNTLEHQPIKVAAMEGHWHRGEPRRRRAAGGLCGPQPAAERNDYEVAIPRLGSLILTHSLDGDITPLTAVAPQDRPPVLPVFFAFRVMVGIGMLMLLVVAFSCWTWWRGRLEQSVWMLRGWQLLSPAGFVALLAGWWVTEIGRQPWVVYGLMRTADAVSPNLQASTVATSLAGYATVYAIIFGAGIWYLWRLLKKGPQAGETPPEMGTPDSGAKTPARPLSLRPTRPTSPKERAHEPRRPGAYGRRRRRLLAAGGVAGRDRLRRADVRAAGRLRARPGHPRPAGRRQRPARPHDEHRRPDLGRQRDLAGAGRRRPDGRLPARVRAGAVVAVSAGAGDAAGADLSRRGV
jgi:hypothetical protein